jgi:K+-transporting ATPase KdpF subunit
MLVKPPIGDTCCRRRSGVTRSCADFEEWIMIFDYSLAALVTAGLLVYLIYALLRPERF